VATAKPPDAQGILIALRHPLRRRILRAMADEKPANPGTLADSLRVDPNSVNYHVQVLAECRVVNLVEEKEVEGCVQRFYRSTLKADWAKSVLDDPGEEPEEEPPDEV
jgi:DNA-binding transcriptional ArsR family regulator